MNGSAPKTRWTGSQTPPTAKPRPNARNDWLELSAISRAIAPSTTSSNNADTAVARRNQKSPQLSSLPSRASTLERARISDVAAFVTIACLDAIEQFFAARAQRQQSGFCLFYHARGKRRVVECPGVALPVVDRPPQEIRQRLA